MQEADVSTTPVPLLWLADGIPLWLLLAVLLLLLALLIFGWRKRRWKRSA